MSDEKKDDGGPAFPVQDYHDGALHAYPGMSLRDHFAGEALCCFLSDNFTPARKESETFAEATARLCYEYADAMIAQRNKK